jgi:hypothetical protein
MVGNHHQMENMQLHSTVTNCHFISLSSDNVFMFHLASDMPEQYKGKGIKMLTDMPLLLTMYKQ